MFDHQRGGLEVNADGQHLPCSAPSDRDAVSASTSQPRSAGGYVPSLFRWLVRQIVRRAGVPLRVVLWNGEEITTASGQPIACVRIRDRWTVLRLLAGADLAFGDA